MSDIAYPWAIGPTGRTATEPDYARHVRDLLEQVLFTNPGERVNRPSFGSGLLHMLFAPTSDEIAATSQMLVQSAIQQWLAGIVQVEDVEVDSHDSTVTVTVQYVIVRTQTRHSDTFTREM